MIGTIVHLDSFERAIGQEFREIRTILHFCNGPKFSGHTGNTTVGYRYEN